jgi:hypothetical protein
MNKKEIIYKIDENIEEIKNKNVREILAKELRKRMKRKR